VTFFYIILLEIHSGNRLPKIDILDLNLIKLGPIAEPTRVQFLCFTV